ncbi:hypothetical protein DF3PB_520003 [uncultured Defluviicoccus sp.]|uniref:Uncharacterized protein n=1 Tax=metagenome TaxID=256318 RepID=A0A380THB3_9ZZZZ|nr:hypothetical protein DF3PB_520003 [uncultured Defluviicoccus sp.]
MLRFRSLLWYHPSCIAIDLNSSEFVTAADVRARVGVLAKSADLAKFIL